jgi:hypothetical protein|tara:strand:- start:778 stop:894 length:117 start_codon:yes stop_codon:yes gene_type:complete
MSINRSRGVQKNLYTLNPTEMLKGAIIEKLDKVSLKYE